MPVAPGALARFGLFARRRHPLRLRRVQRQGGAVLALLLPLGPLATDALRLLRGLDGDAVHLLVGIEDGGLVFGRLALAAQVGLDRSVVPEGDRGAAIVPVGDLHVVAQAWVEEVELRDVGRVAPDPELPPAPALVGPHPLGEQRVPVPDLVPDDALGLHRALDEGQEVQPEPARVLDRFG